MFRHETVYFRLAGLAMFVAFVTALIPQNSFGQGPPGGMAVNVVNTPLPVTGSIGVTGAISATQSGTWNVGINGTPQVAATQSGTWNVGISGSPQVTSADQTVLLDSFVGNIAPSFNEVAYANTTGAKSVRVLTNCFLGVVCGDILVRVYTVVGGRSYLVDQFPMLNFVAGTRVYEVIGSDVTVQLVNNTGTDATNIGVAVFGRAN